MENQTKTDTKITQLSYENDGQNNNDIHHIIINFKPETEKIQRSGNYDDQGFNNYMATANSAHLAKDLNNNSYNGMLNINDLMPASWRNAEPVEEDTI